MTEESKATTTEDFNFRNTSELGLSARWIITDSSTGLFLGWLRTPKGNPEPYSFEAKERAENALPLILKAIESGKSFYTSYGEKLDLEGETSRVPRQYKYKK
jgi:hypothetical protein